MIHKATAMTVRQNLGELLNEVQYRHDSVIITKAGKPIAALVDIDLFERIRRMKIQFNKLTSDLAEAYKDVNDAQTEREIKEALRSIKGK